MAVARVRKIKVRKMPHEYSDGCTLLWMDQPASPAHPHLHPNYEDMEAGRQERRSLPPGRRRLPVRHVKTHASVQENHARDADGRRCSFPAELFSSRRLLAAAARAPSPPGRNHEHTDGRLVQQPEKSHSAQFMNKSHKDELEKRVSVGRSLVASCNDAAQPGCSPADALGQRLSGFIGVATG